VSKPVLYQHFPGKLDLYLALLDQHCQTLERLVIEAISATHDNKERVQAAIAAYFAFVAREDGAFRMVFESDLTGVSAVRQRLDEVEVVCAEAIADVIAEETGADEERSLMLGTALAGLGQVTARHWLAQGGPIPQAEAAALTSTLAWRGLGAFPRVDGDASHEEAEGSGATRS
jgi:AcrR family transcriptional regulator